MVNGVVLVVDAFEGPMPQTKFVLNKALELELSVIVCVNKVDRPEASPDEVVDETLELLMELDAGDKQLDCPFVFAEGNIIRRITGKSARITGEYAGKNSYCFHPRSPGWKIP